MRTAEAESVTQLNQTILQNFKCFMTRVAQLEELGPVGGRFLDGFHQSIQFLGRDSSLDDLSPLTQSIIKANDSRWVRSYVESGCCNNHEIVQNMSKWVGLLNSETCLLGLQEHIAKAKSVLKEIEKQLDDLGRQIQTTYVWLLPLSIKDYDDQLDQGIAACQELNSSKLEELRMTDYAPMMAVVYSMLKQDYLMQERIVTSLNLKSTSEELESYSLMWSLRPFVDDGILHQAWKLI